MSAEIIELKSRSKEEVTCFIFANPCMKIIRSTIRMIRDGVPVLRYLGSEELYNTFLFTGQFDEDTPILAALVPSDNPAAIRWYASELEVLAGDIEKGVYENVATYSAVAENTEVEAEDD